MESIIKQDIHQTFIIDQDSFYIKIRHSKRDNNRVIKGKANFSHVLISEGDVPLCVSFLGQWTPFLVLCWSGFRVARR